MFFKKIVRYILIGTLALMLFSCEKNLQNSRVLLEDDLGWIYYKERRSNIQRDTLYFLVDNKDTVKGYVYSELEVSKIGGDSEPVQKEDPDYYFSGHSGVRIEMDDHVFDFLLYISGSTTQNVEIENYNFRSFDSLNSYSYNHHYFDVFTKLSSLFPEDNNRLVVDTILYNGFILNNTLKYTGNSIEPYNYKELYYTKWQGPIKIVLNNKIILNQIL